jgi:hypothetical protein
MPFRIVKGDDTMNGRMSFEERRYLLVKHKVNLRVRKTLTDGVEQWSGQYGITHLAKPHD